MVYFYSIKTDNCMISAKNQFVTINKNMSNLNIAERKSATLVFKLFKKKKRKIRKKITHPLPPQKTKQTKTPKPKL